MVVKRKIREGISPKSKSELPATFRPWPAATLALRTFPPTLSRNVRALRRYYDLIYRNLKDYSDEAAKIDALLKRFDPIPKQILDIACGTGEHALQLSQHFGYEVDGIDIQSSFIEIAKGKLPNARFEVADMRNFSLGRTYDAALCLFSSIGYVETIDALQDALACIARHLNPGGWLICEPWVSTENWTPGLVDVTHASDPQSDTEVSRTRRGETDGSVAVMKIDYAISTAAGKKKLAETHRLGLFTDKEIEIALEKAGFSFQWGEHGLHNGRIVFAKRLSDQCS
ncbi:Methyltransferase domain family [Verrucomicrobiia bacterium DG1235]|nr:Methyltransferase domain family [Verrucomicrobiae bacterium DG1235]